MPLRLSPVQPTEAEWVDRFVLQMIRREAGESGELLAGLALQLWPHRGHLSPERAADAEYAEWPPSVATTSGASAQNDWTAGERLAECLQGFAA